MSKKTKKTCYMCEAVATSVEHAPPKCLFPEMKDLEEGKDLRKQLISVPACSIHNNQKSNDDVYLLYVLNIFLERNKVSEDHFANKITRDILNSPKVLERLKKYQMPVWLEDNETGERTRGSAIKIEVERIDSSFDHMGRALYFHHFNEKWLGSIHIHKHFALTIETDNLVRSKNLNDASEFIKNSIDKIFADLKSEIYGKNPEVFTYQIEKIDGSVYMRLVFYENLPVTLIFPSLSSN